MESIREGRRLQLNNIVVIDEDDADTYEHSNQSYESLQGGGSSNSEFDGDYAISLKASIKGDKE
eukprot:scaffold1262_cov206-Chaetoceros_neogracile.AAC.13